MTNQNLLEAKPKEIAMSSKEKVLKKKLIALLRDDGRGHHHAKYAERLEKFDIQIVPTSVDPMFTAAISFDTGIIYIGEGFLSDPDTFFQLNVILRHELAHNLLMHQIRMSYKLGEESFARMRFSELLHRLHNIIADDEISNRKYTAEDKIIVRNMMLNGQLIGGLVTEDHRKDWVNLTVEEMYDKICAEITETQEKLLDGYSVKELKSYYRDPVGSAILDSYIYSDILSASTIQGPLKTFIERGCKLKSGLKWKAIFRDIAEQIFTKLDGKVTDDKEILAYMEKISKSSPVEVIDLFSDNSVKLYTPEEKYIALDVLKKFKSEYEEWYGKVVSALEELRDDELLELCDMLK